MSSHYERAVQPLVAKLYLSKTKDEVQENFKELQAIVTSILESEESEEVMTENIIIAFHTLLGMAKVQCMHNIEVQARIDELEKAIKK